MANCVICSIELKFTNTPAFGSGKLNDGGDLCSSCVMKINKINPNVAFNLKKETTISIKELFLQKSNEENQKIDKLDEILSQIKALQIDNASQFFGRKEIKELPSILAPSEKIDNLIQGVYSGGFGILVSTNRRLIFIDKGLFYGLKVEDFPLDKITSIQYETGLMFGEIKIHTSANIAKIENVDKSSARKFAEFIRDKLSQPKENISVSSQPDILEQIEKLAKLKENGILSEQEFVEQKKKLLEKL
jgi:hypothetical protein